MTIILFILIFSVVVIAHELGHFLLAKKNGIKVIEFSIGMGPVLASFTKGETKYALKLLPIGGACMFEGEDGVNTKEEGDETFQDEKFDDSGSFQKANVWARISTVVAGPIFNFILAFFFSIIVVSSIGADIPIIGDVMEGYPAAEQGLQKGDTLISLNGDRVYLYREVSMYSMFNAGEVTDVVYERDGKRYETTLVPKYVEEEGRYYLGFYNGGYNEKLNPLEVLKYSVYEVRYWIKTTMQSLSMMVQGKVSKDDIAGPIGIATVVDDVYEAAKPAGWYTVFLNMLNIAILLSANLGVVNLLPLPALDGGRLFFMIIEVLRGKPVAPEKEGMVHFAGFVALMLLMVFVMYNDIVRIFAGG